MLVSTTKSPAVVEQVAREHGTQTVTGLCGSSSSPSSPFSSGRQSQRPLDCRRVLANSNTDSYAGSPTAPGLPDYDLIPGKGRKSPDRLICVISCSCEATGWLS
ncbi:hypothetical protein PFLUV_G00101110 [Perca fluviatilis]|uniref:Uncharacterized protein n=1 Tax=Perca fluviatilis TaxID=8168 RepID=A0A6A5EY29_PERFL|nr:hypothetical protein PFLUV_G00101110 [Perca fluviatilis]